MSLYRNASDFIPLTMIPLTELAVGYATGRANLSRRNQVEVEGAGETGELRCHLASKISAGRRSYGKRNAR